MNGETFFKIHFMGCIGKTWETLLIMGIIIDNSYFVFQSVSSIQFDGIDLNFTRTAIIEKYLDLPRMPKAIDR